MLNLKDIVKARFLISKHIHHTGMLYSSSISKLFGNDVYLKCESLQKTGSFKVRGAFNTILSLSETESKSGTICYSSGNHAQAVVYASSKLGIESWAVMPATAPTSKIDACREYGGKVVLHGQTGAESYPKAIEIMKEKGS